MFHPPDDIASSIQKSFGNKILRVQVYRWIATHCDCVGPYDCTGGNKVWPKRVVYSGDVWLYYSWR